jgi:hypothetical protein
MKMRFAARRRESGFPGRTNLWFSELFTPRIGRAMLTA